MGDIELFESKHIHSVWNEVDEKWYFSVPDVVQILADSIDVKQYIKKVKGLKSKNLSDHITDLELIP